MKAIVIDNYGGKEQLKEREVDVPAISENQVLLEVKAASINPVDWKLREGYLKEMVPFEFPVTLGCDAAGIIKETGKNVSRFKVGDRVFSRPETLNHGTYAEFVPVDEELLAKMPEEMSFEEAAAMPLAALTAWQCLVDFSDIKKDDKVLIQAGAGGVGIFAVQLARYFGAYTATTASKENTAFVKSLGADEVINYKEEDFSKILSGYDIVLDAMGGEIMDKGFDVLKQGGKLVSIAGMPSEEKAHKLGVKAGIHWIKSRGDQLQKLADLYEAGELKPVIGHRFHLTEQGLKDAHELSETHHARGKIVIKV